MNLFKALTKKKDPKVDYDRANHLLLHIILGGVEKIMANFDDLKAKLQGVASGVDSLEDAIKALKEQVAAGQVITAEQLDELDALVDAIGADIADDSDR